jgi:uncharacterized membrane protein
MVVEESKASNSSYSEEKVISSDKLPPPEILQKYESIMPGLAKILVDKANLQTRHRIDIERRTVISNIIKSTAGLIFGFLIGIFGLGGGFYLTTKGYNVVGFIFTSSTLVTLVMTFIYGSQSRRNERQKIGEVHNSNSNNKIHEDLK